MEVKKNKLSEDEREELKTYRLLKQLTPHQIDELLKDLLDSPQLNEFNIGLVEKMTPYDIDKLISAESGTTTTVQLVKVTGEILGKLFDSVFLITFSYKYHP